MFRVVLGLSLVIVGCSVDDFAPLWLIPAFAVPGLLLMFSGVVVLNQMEK